MDNLPVDDKELPVQPVVISWFYNRIKCFVKNDNFNLIALQVFKLPLAHQSGAKTIQDDLHFHSTLGLSN